MLTYKGRDLFLDGKPFTIRSGAIHYVRVIPEYWEDRLSKLKAAGLNTVETYTAWNMHEPQEGKFVFDGAYDIVRFVETAHKLGLYVIIRPGPYACGEWDFGGFPAWLLKYDSLKLRCLEPTYMKFVERYFHELLSRLAPLQQSLGGNIIAFQVENEYGSYGRDREYMRRLRDVIRAEGCVELLFTSDGETDTMLSGGGLPEELMVTNFNCAPKYGFKQLEQMQPDKPLMCGEYWSGWFDHFREKHHTTSIPNFTNAIKAFLEKKASFNLYMFHGGTNFGYTAGANYADVYQPTTTSYDYDSPLNEYGGYTEKYYELRKLLLTDEQAKQLPLPPSPKLQKMAPVNLTEYAEVMPNIAAISRVVHTHIPNYMEYYDANNGYILYHTEFSGKYSNCTLTADGVHDIAYVYINGKFVQRYDRTLSKDERVSVDVPAFDGKIVIDILVEAMGRINFSHAIYDRKGLSAVSIGGQYIYNWDIYLFSSYNGASFNSGKPAQYPSFLRGEFDATSKDDCFVDIEGFTKGVVWVNGFNLGKYWNVGPCRTLYLPGALLREHNEIVVLEQESAPTTIQFTDAPAYFTDTNKKKRFSWLFKKNK